MVKKTKQGEEIELLQFECENCEFKIYINSKDKNSFDDIEKVKCINCGRRRAIRKRKFKIIILKYGGIKCLTCGHIPKMIKLGK